MNRLFKSGKRLKSVKHPAVSITFQALLVSGIFVLLLLTVGYRQEHSRSSRPGRRRCAYLTDSGNNFARLLSRLDPSDSLKSDENGGFMSLLPEFQNELSPGLLRVEEKMAVPRTPEFVPFRTTALQISADLRPMSGNISGNSGTLPAVMFDDNGREVARWQSDPVPGGVAFIRVRNENIYRNAEVFVSCGSEEVDRKLLQLIKERELPTGAYCAVFPKSGTKVKENN